MYLKLSELALVLTLLFGLVSCNRTNAGGVQGTGTTGKIAKWSNSMTITDSAINESSGNVGIGVSTPGEKLHIADGNLLIEGGREQAHHDGECNLSADGAVRLDVVATEQDQEYRERDRDDPAGWRDRRRAGPDDDHCERRRQAEGRAVRRGGPGRPQAGAVQGQGHPLRE